MRPPLDGREGLAAIGCSGKARPMRLGESEQPSEVDSRIIGTLPHFRTSAYTEEVRYQIAFQSPEWMKLAQ